MNKTQLRQSFVDKGYKVEPISTWDKVSQVETITKYDVNVADPQGKFYTAQVVVENDGTPEEEAKAYGQWESKPATFGDELQVFLRSREQGKVYAVVQKEVYAQDEAALVDVYMINANGDLDRTSYLVRRRSNSFDFKAVTR